MAAEEKMKEATENVTGGIQDALSLIRSIKGNGDEAMAQGNEILVQIAKIKDDAYAAVDQLALTGPFVNALSDVRVEIRQTMKRVERLEPGPNRDRLLSTMQAQTQRFNELQESIVAKEGEIVGLLSEFNSLEKEIELSIQVGQIGELVAHLENIEQNLANMTTTLGEVLEYEVGEVEDIDVVVQ
jgi:SMC interacting uncharacterized protein involved in chromosome segregation